MQTEIMEQLMQEIRAAGRIILCRHVHPDGDAVGSSLGLRQVLRASYPDKDIRLINRDRSEAFAFLGEEDEKCSGADYREALVIALDTATRSRISSAHYEKAPRLLRLDHHPAGAPYGDLAWIEPELSSASEMVAALCQAYPQELKLTPAAARCLYTGIVTDTDRFHFGHGLPGAMERAAWLLAFGIDTEELFARLYLKPLEELKFQAYVLQHMKITEHGVVYAFISREIQEKFHITPEQASFSVNYLSGIQGSPIWMVFIENRDNPDIRVRLRARFAAVSPLAERYEGGGHPQAAGATVHSRPQMRRLLREADTLLGEEKQKHADWM